MGLVLVAHALGTAQSRSVSVNQRCRKAITTSVKVPKSALKFRRKAR